MSLNLQTLAGDSRFSLVRLILVDSYTEGRITELPLQGGTAITGRNGRGKTSLLQLIPAFYGERPDRIVRPVSNKKSFARYYLPRSTSFVIFEYRRDDVSCCAILFADESGEAVHYRFMRSAYRRDLFVLEDERSIVMSAGLPERMKLKGVTVSRKMPLDEYRAVIQGKMGHGSDRAKQRQLIADFSFCPTSHPLPHIERIVSGMFQRKTNFNDLQRMVVTSLPGGGNQIALGAERKKIESWPDVYDSYTAVMSDADRMGNVQGAYEAVLAAEHELRCVHARFVLLDSHLSEQHSQTKSAHGQAIAALTEAEQAHDSAIRAMQETIQALDRDIRFNQDEIERLNRESTEFEQQNVKAKADLLEREEQILQTKAHLEARKAILIGQQADIDRRYQELLNTLERDHLRRMPSFNDQRSKLNDGFRNYCQALDADRERDQTNARLAAKPAIDTAQEQVDHANQAIGATKANLANPQPDPALVEELERQASKVSEARKKWQESVDAQRAAQQQYDEAKAAYGLAERQLANLVAESERFELEVKQLRVRATPGETSVLYALRMHRPDWTQDIAKVIREDLLVRTDLSPVVKEIQEGIYGLQLDLDRLDAPLAADEVALRREIETREDALQTLARRIEDQRIALEQAGERRQRANDNAELKGREQAGTRAALASAETLEKSARQAVKNSRDNAKAKAESAHSDAQRHAREARGTLEQKNRELELALAACVTVHTQATAAAKVSLDQALAEVKRKEGEAEAEYQRQCQTVNRERADKLKSTGVDTEALQALERQISAAGQELETIAGARNLVAQWRLWLSSQWARLPGLEATLKQSRNTRKVKDDERQASDRTWKTVKASKVEAISSLSTKLTNLTAERERVESRRRTLEGHEPDGDTLGQDYDPAWNFNALVTQANAQLRVAKEQDAKLTDDIRAIKANFVSRRGTPPEHFYDTHRQQMGPDKAEHAREWVPVFKAWYSTEHETYRNLLRVEARTIAEAVGDFHGRMSRFHRDVALFNRSLQDSLNANLGFESISSVSVEIVSSIRELDYWSTIEKVADSRVVWMGDPSTMPPPEFAASLRELLEHWQIKEGIRAELTNLIRIQGEVVENGTRRPFKKAEDLETISSHGLSYIVLVLIFIGFINRVRGSAPVNVVWALDEIKDLDVGNVELLMDILARNNITLVSACPDPDPDVLALFKNRCSIRADRCIYDTAGAAGEPEDSSLGEEEACV